MAGTSTPFSLIFRSLKLRRAFALSAVVLATGGLVLYKAPSSGAFPSVTSLPEARPLSADGKNAVAFSGPGAHGVLSLSHTSVLAGKRTPVYAELRLVADPSGAAVVRAPISLAVVLDTSGSMSGDKIEDAKRSVLRLVADMRDEDEVAVVRYSDTSEVLQPLARVGNVRSELNASIRAIHAGGGTNIPDGLAHGLQALEEAAGGRVRRIVLVSDGLDGTRAEAERLARSSFASGITVSSLGIGLDFDERYMGAVAQGGHGNFAFINDGASLAGFLKRELEQTSLTTIENARVMMEVPSGLRFVSATGADATSDGRSVELRLGSLFAGDERRVIVEFAVDGLSVEATAEIRTSAAWSRVGQSMSNVSVPSRWIHASADANEVERGRDGAVLASATSVVASKRQLEAASAYGRGDVAQATALAAENEAALGAALAAAPPEAAPRITAQMNAYATQKQGFRAYRPSSAEGRTVAKSAAAKDLGNLNRASSF